MAKDYLYNGIYGKELKAKKNEAIKANMPKKPGNKYMPNTLMGPIDNKMTQMPDRNIVPQNKKDRPTKYQYIKKTFKELVHLGMSKINDKHISNKAL